MDDLDAWYGKVISVDLVGARHASPAIVEQRLDQGDACIAPTVHDSEL